MKPAKRARADMVRYFADVSITDSALARVLAKIKKRPELIDEIPSSSVKAFEHHLTNERMSQLRQVSTSMDLPLEAGGLYSCPLLSPHRLLRFCVDQCPGMHDLIASTLRRKPFPWHIIIYADELTPGNVLRPDNRRKVSAIYWSFKEFGPLLHNEHVWLVAAVLRHNVINTLSGGISAVIKMLLRELFLSDAAINSAGVVLRLQSEPVLMHAVLSNIIADEAELKAIWGVKGSSGLRPCMLCKNLCMKDSQLARHAVHYLVEIDTSDFAAMDLTSNEDIWFMTDFITAQHAVLGKAAMDELEKASGIRYNPHGILADIELRQHVAPVDVNTIDPCHTYFSHGTAAEELHLFLDACKRKANLKFEQFRQFCAADWKAPKRTGRTALLSGAVFSDAREHASKDCFKGMASEVLSVFPLVRQLAEATASQHANLQKELASFRAMHDVIDLLQQAKHSLNAPSFCSQWEIAQKNTLNFSVSLIAAITSSLSTTMLCTFHRSCRGTGSL